MALDVRLIAAVGRSGQIGLDGKLPWEDKADLKWFAETTAGGYIIVGGVTYKSTPDFKTHNRVKIGWGRDVDPYGLLATFHQMDPKRPLWIAGGARTYEAFMPFVRRFYIARIDYDGPADTFMPPLWSVSHGPDPKEEGYTFQHPVLGTIHARSDRATDIARACAQAPSSQGQAKQADHSRAAQSLHPGDQAIREAGKRGRDGEGQS